VSHSHVHRANPHTAKWVATADKKKHYLLSKRIVPGATSWWDSWVYREVRPGDNVLLFQTYGGASDSLRGIYGVAEVVKVTPWNDKNNNIKLRYLAKFSHFIPLYKPFPERIRTLASKLETPFLMKRILAIPQEIRGFIPVTRNDLPLLTEIMDSAKSYAEETSVESEPNVAVGKEGRTAFLSILRRERNQRLANEAKKDFAKKHGGRLFCEVCGFDFTKKYGDRGIGFIECHHKVPVSSFRREKTTSLRDLVLLCSNCHSMIHNKLPWLTVDQLRDLAR
jgi:hypothetical protein